MESILITGASGFLGSFIVEEALKRNYNVWAGMRATSNRRNLKQRKIHFFELDFAHPSELRAQLSGYKGTHSRFDYIVHCAGVTKSIRDKEFDYVNYLQTRYFVETLRELNMVPKQFIYISTLSVYGPIHERDGKQLSTRDLPQPNTLYGISKLKTELYLQSVPVFPYVIIRPTGIYGPREKDYFLMAKSIARHVDFAAGFRKQELTFVYVKDVARVPFLCIKAGVRQRSYLISDGEVHSSRDYSNLLRRELGNPWVIRFTCPIFLLKAISLVAGTLGKWRGKPTTLNPDKCKIMKQRNWRCDITPAVNELGYYPEYNLERGVHETVNWYKENEWL
jgi:UDP-glucose 4-epimerase